MQLEKDEITARVTTDEHSPWFAGHFPGDPILPGIAQLKMVADAIAASGEPGRMAGLSRIKFRKIIRPGDVLDIHAAGGKGQGQYLFRISSCREEVCSGMMLFATREVDETEG